MIKKKFKPFVQLLSNIPFLYVDFSFSKYIKIYIIGRDGCGGTFNENKNPFMNLIIPEV